MPRLPPSRSPRIGRDESKSEERDNANIDVERPLRVSPETNEHRALWLVQRYTSTEEVEAVTRRALAGTDLQEQAELTDDQIGNALFGLYRKRLLKAGDESEERKLNEYQLTQKGRDELEWVGAPALS